MIFAQVKIIGYRFTFRGTDPDRSWKIAPFRDWTNISNSQVLWGRPMMIRIEDYVVGFSCFAFASLCSKTNTVVRLSASLSTPQICLQELKMKEVNVSCLLKIYRIFKHSQTEIGLVFQCGTCVLLFLLVATFLIITLPIYFCSLFIGYAHVGQAFFVNISSMLAFSLRLAAPVGFDRLL